MGKIENLLKQSKELERKLITRKITPRSYETRDKTIRTKIRNILNAEGKDFVPCPNRAWHHLGTTCEVCGQYG